MSNKLYQDLQEKFEERGGEDWIEFFTEGYDDAAQGFEFVYQEGGGEGMGEHCEAVIKVDEEFYKITYSYYSHVGYDFDYPQAFKVAPKEKTITVYE